jgi:hypothetical protein
VRNIHRKTAASLLPAVAVAASIMAAGVAGNVLGTYINGTLEIGHIIAFEPSPMDEAGTDTRLVVQRTDESDCVLDLNMLRRFGGSLLVESRITGEAAGFRAHWAGQHTSNDSDCGADATLIVGRPALDLLAAAAGGYGAGPDRATVFALGILK